jgi:tRNA-modifying protein YgfZ
MVELADLGAYQVIDVTGGDRVSFLHRLVTANVEDVAVGQGRPSLLLTVKGQIVVAMDILVGAERVRLIVPPGLGAPTVTALSRYAIMDDVAITLAAELAPVVLVGDGAATRLRAAGLEVPATVAAGPPLAHAEVAFAGQPALVVRRPSLGRDAIWVFSERAGALTAALADVPSLSAEASEALRILAGEPKTGSEVTEDVFPMEVGLNGAIDYGKGCYLGQEPIVRIRDRGHINWRLAGVRAAGTMAAGDKLETDARPKAGRITSAVRLPDGTMAALALLHVSVPIGSELRVLHGEERLPAMTVAAGGASDDAGP